jgi:hypothetical protein
MSNLAVGLLALALTAGSVGIIAWQWRTGDLIDPILSGFAPEGWKRPLMWLTTLLYGSVTVLGIIAAFHLAFG